LLHFSSLPSKQPVATAAVAAAVAAPRFCILPAAHSATQLGQAWQRNLVSSALCNCKLFSISGDEQSAENDPALSLSLSSPPPFLPFSFLFSLVSPSYTFFI